MAVSIVNTGSANNSANTSFTFNYGFSPSEGNLLIACLTKNNDTDSPANISDDSDTWTELYQAKHSSALTAVFWKVVSASEPTSEVFTHGDSGKWAGGIVEYSGQDTTTPINDSTFSVDFGVSPTSQKVITTVDSCGIIAGAGINNISTITLEGSLSSRWNIQTTSVGAVTIAAGSRIQSIAGSTGDFIHSLSSSQSWFAYTIAIAPLNDDNINLVMDGADITLDGASASFTNTALTSEPQSLWFFAGTWKEPTFGQVTFGVPSQIFTLQMLGKDIVLDGASTTFNIIENIFALATDGDDITLGGDSASFEVIAASSAEGGTGGIDEVEEEKILIAARQALKLAIQAYYRF